MEASSTAATRVVAHRRGMLGVSVSALTPVVNQFDYGDTVNTSFPS